jgi:hypothetical protein
MGGSWTAQLTELTLGSRLRRLTAVSSACKELLPALADQPSGLAAPQPDDAHRMFFLDGPSGIGHKPAAAQNGGTARPIQSRAITCRDGLWPRQVTGGQPGLRVIISAHRAVTI